MEDSFTFTYTAGGTAVSMSIEADTWPEALEAFISFMGASYGYSIREKVSLERSVSNHSGQWTGPIFNGEEYV